jgi:hypothetical protein
MLERLRSDLEISFDGQNYSVPKSVRNKRVVNLTAVKTLLFNSTNFNLTHKKLNKVMKVKKQRLIDETIHSVSPFKNKSTDVTSFVRIVARKRYKKRVKALSSTKFNFISANDYEQTLNR